MITLYDLDTYLPIDSVETQAEAEFEITHNDNMFYYVPDHSEYIERLNTGWRGDL